MAEIFDELIAAGAAVDVSGWDFSWLDGRATEERPPWGYARRLGDRLGRASAWLDIQTGGGEVVSEATQFPSVAVATESWPPNVDRATQLLQPRGWSLWPIRTSRRCRSPTEPSIWSAVGTRRRSGGMR